ncbi:MAG TPA: tetratricopeptide repeat protein [Polyangiaceae bacterium]|nr:tetratricopeptide repeat protein [Polyangiaceae bacterium]
MKAPPAVPARAPASPPTKPPPKPLAKPPPKPLPKPAKPVETAPRAHESARATLDPSVLVVGADDVFLSALKLALARHRVHVESSSLEQAVETVVVAAPDLILLANEAARDAGHGLLAKLTSSPVSSVIPVVILGGDSALDARLRAFRHGATAVIPRTASIDAVAETIGKLAREIPERGGDALGEVGEATLEEFVGALTKELRSGILSLDTGEEKAPVRLVLGSGRPLAAFIDEFVRRARQHVVRAEPLRYEFDDRAGGTVQLLPEESGASEPPPGNIRGLRLLLADNQPSRADLIAQALRARGAEVVIGSLDPNEPELRRIRQLDPEVILIGERELEGAGYALLRRMKRDTRLRWASLLVVRWDEISGPTSGVPAIERLTGPLATLAEADRGLCDRAELGGAFDARLEVNGPARCLRALAASGRSLRLTLHNNRLTVSVDISDGLIVGATANAPSGETWGGAQALAAFMVLSSGRIHVEPAEQPATTNLMAEVDAALSLAESEPAPIAPSLPANAIPSEAPLASSAVEPQIPRAAPVPRGLDVDPLAQTAAAIDALAITAPVALPPTVVGPAEVPPAAAPPEAPPAPVAKRRLTPAKLIESFPRLEAAARLSEHPRFRVKGISPPIAALLVAIAVVQGLLAAVIYKYVHRTAPVDARDLASAVAQSAATAAAPAVPATPAPGATPAPSAAATPLASSAPTPSASTELPRDEQPAPAPSCDELLKDSPGGGENPGAAFEQIKLARKALVQGKSDDAERAYCKAVRWDPQNIGYYFELAQLLLIRRDGAAAAEWAQKGARLDPANTRGQSLVGDGLARIGDFDGARRAWYAAASVNTPSAQEVEQLFLRAQKEAEQALATHDYMRAERFFRRAAVLDPKNASAQRGLASSLLRIGEAKNALAWARRAEQLAPKDATVQLTLGDALLATGDDAGARQAWTEAERLGYPDARRRLERLAKRP